MFLIGLVEVFSSLEKERKNKRVLFIRLYLIFSFFQQGRQIFNLHLLYTSFLSSTLFINHLIIFLKSMLFKGRIVSFDIVSIPHFLDFYFFTRLIFVYQLLQSLLHFDDARPRNLLPFDFLQILIRANLSNFRPSNSIDFS